ncbi:MAG: TraR/DksA family transcriptional regulator [Ilumatobacteraceae bacterium]
MPSKKPVKKAPAKKAPAKKVPAKKAPAKKVPAKKAPVKKAPAKNAPAKKAPAKKAPAKKAPAKKAPAKKAPAKKAAAKKAPAKKAPAKKAPVKKAPVKKAPAKKTPTAKAPAKKAVVVKAPAKKAAPKKPIFVKPPVPGKRPVSKDGIISNKDFDLAFLRARREQLSELRDQYLGQVAALDRERELLIEASGMGDDQFDEDGGEGDTLAVERERAKMLSEQDRQIVMDIEAALVRIETGDYGYSVVSTKPIPRERLEFIPWATELVTERVGGIGQR